MSRRRAPEEDVRDREPRAALGTRGQPARWRRAVEGARVALARPDWGDARASYLFGEDTSYAPREYGIEGELPDLPLNEVNGPLLKAPVWTWEIPAYFWLGGIAAGSSWIAVATGSPRARKVTLAAALPCAPLLIMDLGRPKRFLNMLRIFKPRSPMSMGAWCLAAFSNAAALAVVRDSRAASAAAAALGLYLGSYTGVLLACTAVPVWSRSRELLPPIFVCTSVASAAAANRLAGVRTGPLQTGALVAELALSAVNDRRLGDLRPHNRLFVLARTAAAAAILTRRSRSSSVLTLASGLAFRFAWVEAGKASARDDEAVARAARE